MTYRSKLAALLAASTAAACSTTPVEPEPELELTDSYEYRIDLWVDASAHRGDTILFEDEIEEYSDATPLANTILGQSAGGASGTAFSSVEPLEITTGADVRTGAHADVWVDAEGEAEWGLNRCGYPVGTPFRIVATMAAASAAVATGDFPASDGSGGFDVSVGVRVRTGGAAAWTTAGDAHVTTDDNNGYTWTWDEGSFLDPDDQDVTAFFQGFDGGSSTRDSPPLVVGSDGCIQIEAGLETEATVHADTPESLQVSGSYSLSVQIET